MFIHDDPEFGALVRLVARDHQIAPALVEKDYWVTHTLWSLQHTGLEIAFKGGTSLSKAFHLIQRFSEDVDVKIEPGAVSGLPTYGSLRSETEGATRKRRVYFESLLPHLRVANARITLAADQDPRYRSAVFIVDYPSEFRQQLLEIYRPHILLEAGLGVTPPSVSMPIDSFIHTFLTQRSRQTAYTWNLPSDVQCVHPLVTLLEKLDAITRRYTRDPFLANSIIRHYEDAAHIIQHMNQLPPLPADTSVTTLAALMLTHRQIRRPVTSDDPAFTLADAHRRGALEAAHQAIAPMFWGERLSLGAACAIIQAWLDQTRPYETEGRP
jgi:hypothetical protein